MRRDERRVVLGLKTRRLLDVDIRIEGMGRFLQYLRGKKRLMEDMRPVFQKIRYEFYEHMEDVFESEGAILGERWTPLNRRYAAWKAKRFPGRKILERTGKLKRSLTGKGGAGAVVELDKDELSIGTDVWYAHRHQEGVPAFNLPPRPFLHPPPKLVRRWADLIRAHVVEND